MHVFIDYILVSFFPRRVKLALDKLLQGSWNISNHFNSHIFHGFSSMREVLCSSRLWQCWLQMLFIGSNPGDGAGAGFMLWTVWGWYGLRGNITSPWAGLLCHPAIPAARPRARWQRKFPELSTCNVTLITQWDKQKGGYWSRLLPGWLSCHLRFPYFFYLYFLWASKNPNFTTENRWEGVSSLDSNCPQGLTHLSEPARDSWNTKKGFYDNSSATLPSACVLWERRRQRLSHRHLGLFSPLCSGEIVPLEHTNGLRSFH